MSSVWVEPGSPHRVGADAARNELEGEHMGKAEELRLRRRVGAVVEAGGGHHVRHDVDNGAPLAALHGGEAADPCIVDENGFRGTRTFDGGHGGICRRLVNDIDSGWAGASTSVGDLACCRALYVVVDIPDFGPRSRPRRCAARRTVRCRGHRRSRWWPWPTVRSGSSIPSRRPRRGRLGSGPSARRQRAGARGVRPQSWSTFAKQVTYHCRFSRHPESAERDWLDGHGKCAGRHARQEE